MADKVEVLIFLQAAAEAKVLAAKAKEAETIKLRAQQERAADTRSQVDQLRAQRRESYDRTICDYSHHCTGVVHLCYRHHCTQ